jgi:glucokinase
VNVGGTKTDLALFEKDARGKGLRMVRDMTLPSGDFPSLEAIIERFLDSGRGRSSRARASGWRGPSWTAAPRRRTCRG